MFALLTKRLARSLWRKKIMLIAVTLMVTVGVLAGISFASYAHTASGMYGDIYADTDDGVNLPDVWVENPSGTWDEDDSDSICEDIANQWPDSELVLNECEPRMRLDGLMFLTDEEGEEKSVPAIWHGIDEGYIDRVWFPDHDCCSGHAASEDDEIVIDVRVAKGMDIGIGEVISIGSGAGRMDFTVVGIGLHSNHLYFAQEGILYPAVPGTFATGYLSATGLERLANISPGSSNLLLIDIVGTPDYDLQSTTENEGEELSAMVDTISSILNEADDTPLLVYDRSGVNSVEFLRADAEGAMMMYTPVTAMIAIIAGITIFLSLQRLVQSQAREIAILRTLGIPRSAIMPGYILMPLVIGLIGSSFGTLLGVFVGAPAMLGLYEEIIGVPILNPTDVTPLIIQIGGISMTVVMISGILPAIQASRLQPLEVMRGQHEVRFSSRGIQKLTSRLPATAGLTIRSSIRKPTRLAFTFIAVGLSMLLFGSMTLMMETMEDMTVGGIKERQNWDAQVVVPFGGEAAVIDWADEREAAHESVLMFPGNPEGDSRYLLAYGLDTLSIEDDAMMVLDLKEGSIPAVGSATTQILIDEGLHVFLEWDVGQTQTVMFGSSAKQVEITGITQGEISRTIYFHREDLARIIGIEATSVLIVLPEGVEVDSELGDISLGITQKEDLVRTFESLLEQQQAAFGAILFLGILIAAVVLFNTLLLNLAERDTEIATLRVLGAPIRRIRWMMFGEHLAIGLIGGILAFIFTIVGTQALVDSFVQWAFFFTVQADPYVAAELIGIVVLVSVLLTPYGTSRIQRMELVEKVKDLSQ